MPSENWFTEFLSRLTESGRLPPQESLPQEVAEVDDAVKGLLSQGDRLLVSPTFRLLLEQSRSLGVREARDVVLAQLAPLQEQVAQLRQTVSLRDIEVAALRSHLLLTQGLLAQTQTMLKFLQGANPLAVESVRADAQVKGALIGAGASVLGKLLGGGES